MIRKFKFQASILSKLTLKIPIVPICDTHFSKKPEKSSNSCSVGLNTGHKGMPSSS